MPVLQRGGVPSTSLRTCKPPFGYAQDKPHSKSRSGGTPQQAEEKDTCLKTRHYKIAGWKPALRNKRTKTKMPV